jgi:hypothetical protein
MSEPDTMPSDVQASLRLEMRRLLDRVERLERELAELRLVVPAVPVQVASLPSPASASPYADPEDPHALDRFPAAATAPFAPGEPDLPLARPTEALFGGARPPLELPGSVEGAGVASPSSAPVVDVLTADDRTAEQQLERLRASISRLREARAMAEAELRTLVRPGAESPIVVQTAGDEIPSAGVAEPAHGPGSRGAPVEGIPEDPRVAVPREPAAPVPPVAEALVPERSGNEDASREDVAKPVWSRAPESPRNEGSRDRDVVARSPDSLAGSGAAIGRNGTDRERTEAGGRPEADAQEAAGAPERAGERLDGRRPGSGAEIAAAPETELPLFDALLQLDAVRAPTFGLSTDEADSLARRRRIRLVAGGVAAVAVLTLVVMGRPWLEWVMPGWDAGRSGPGQSPGVEAGATGSRSPAEHPSTSPFHQSTGETGAPESGTTSAGSASTAAPGNEPAGTPVADSVDATARTTGPSGGSAEAQPPAEPREVPAPDRSMGAILGAVSPLPARVELHATREVWLRVIVDGERAVERLLAGGAQAAFDVGERITVRAGDAGAVRVVLGGADLGALGSDGAVVTRTFELGTRPR